jgi:chromosome segregation ATPase
MKAILPILISSAVLLAACNSSSERQAQIDVLAQELRAQRQELNQLRSKLDADRQRIQRAVLSIESYAEDLDRTLDQASAEIWGDGSSTGALLSTARRSLDSLQAEVNALVNELRATRR